MIVDTFWFLEFSSALVMVQEGKANSRDNFTAKVIVTFVVEFLHFVVLLTSIVKYCRVYKTQFFR